MTLFWILLFSGEAVWQWPIDVAESPTSSFGEYRGHRFHMGLDFSTGGVEGKIIRPAADGVVFKIRATVRGFGRVVYVRHDEHITVYAHLARFGPKLEAVVKEKNKDPLDWFGTIEMNLPISRSDTLAWSGESGAGMPHLHFETRDKANRPVDPLTLPFPTLPGINKPSLLKGLRFLPLDANSEVNGDTRPFHTSPKVERIQAKGKVGVQLHAYAQGSRGNRLGPRGVRLKVGEEIVAQWLPRHLDFAFNGNAGLVFDQAYSGFGPTRYAYAFDDRASYLPSIGDFQQSAVLNITEPTQITVELMNLSGSWRSHQYTLDPEAKTQTGLAPLPSPIQATSLQVYPWRDHLYIQTSMEGTLQAPDELIGMGAGEALVYEVKKHQAQAPLIWRTGGSSLKREVAALKADGHVQLKLGHWTLQGKGKYPHQAVVLEPPARRVMSDVLDYQSPVIQFGRPGLPARNLHVSYDVTTLKDPENIGIYAWSHQKQKWRWLGGSSSELKARLNHLAPMVVARDISPPLILKPKRHPYFTGERVVIPIREKGSGVDADTLEITTPKGPLSGVYDSDRGWIILPRGTTRGPWTVSVSDRAGNNAVSRNLR